MAPPRDTRTPGASDLEDTEARVRQALGVQDRSVSRPMQHRAGQPRPRHRFVQDGEVPVVVLNTPKNADTPSASRIQAVEAALDAERTARADAERSLREAEATIQALRTKLAHAELAHGEALATEREARERAEQALREATAAPATEEPLARGIVAAATAPEKPKRSRRPAGTAAAAAKTREPRPVKWWLPKRPVRAEKP